MLHGTIFFSADTKQNCALVYTTAPNRLFVVYVIMEDMIGYTMHTFIDIIRDSTRIFVTYDL